MNALETLLAVVARSVMASFTARFGICNGSTSDRLAETNA